MQVVRLADLPTETISHQVKRQVIWGEKGTLARYFLSKSTHVLPHAHDSEQHTYVIQRAIRMGITSKEGKAEEVIVRADEIFVLPGGLQHEVWILEETVLWDFFAPPRQDWLLGPPQ